MRNGLAVFGAAGLGAAWMYFFDRHSGKRRRALLRDSVTGGVHRAQREFGKAARDLENRTAGASARARHAMERALSTGPQPDDGVVKARVRTALGRSLSHPQSVWVQVSEGRVTLKGDALESEAGHVMDAVKSVDGVTNVISELTLHTDDEGLPGMPGRRTGRRRSSWAPGVRLAAGTGGGLLAAWGLASRGATGLAAGLTGSLLMARAMANRRFRDVASSNGNANIEIQKTVKVNAPIAEVFSFLTHFPNLPRFMTHLQEVREMGGGRFHWVADGPAGLPVSWDAEVTKLVPNQLVEWRSLPGSRIRNEGRIRFEETGDGGTRIGVRLAYNPPGGVAGHWLASLFRADPKHEMDDDFVRLKSLLELGKTRSREGKQVTYDRESHSARLAEQSV